VRNWFSSLCFFTCNLYRYASLSIMLPQLNAYTTGQLLAIYEHRRGGAS
jgi:hypothetical protein